MNDIPAEHQNRQPGKTKNMRPQSRDRMKACTDGDRRNPARQLGRRGFADRQRCRASEVSMTADLPPCGGDVRQDRGGRCPAGVSTMRSASLRSGPTSCGMAHLHAGLRPGKCSTLPPSVLPDISPARGEISRRVGFRQSPAFISLASDAASYMTGQVLAERATSADRLFGLGRSSRGTDGQDSGVAPACRDGCADRQAFELAWPSTAGRLLEDCSRCDRRDDDDRARQVEHRTRKWEPVSGKIRCSNKEIERQR